MNWIQNHYTDITRWVAEAGGLAVVLSRLAHLYDSIVNYGGIVNIVKALFLGSAKDVTIKPKPVDTQNTTT